MEGMSGISVDEARGILDNHDLIGVSVRADDERRRRHGTRTTFVRVLEIHVDAVPGELPAASSAGEIRLTGAPKSLEDAASAVTRAKTLAGSIPLTAFSLADLSALSGGAIEGLREVLAAVKAAGLQTIAEVPVDLLPDPAALVKVAREAGLDVPRLTVHTLTEETRIDTVERARAIQAAVGGVRTFAPLPRHILAAQPSTGYDDVRQVAVARLLLDNIESIQVDWALYGPKLAQVALTMGADDVDGVSAFEGELGRRRSPLEEIRGNIRAAGLDPAERDALFAARS
jgi:aminodeoxyfutalosine synthase